MFIVVSVVMEMRHPFLSGERVGMLARAVPLFRKHGVRHLSGSELSSMGSGFGSVVGIIGAAIGGFYVLDQKIETKTNHIEQKIDALAQSVNSLAVSIAKIEEHTR